LRQVVDQKFGSEVVGAIDDEIVFGQEARAVLGIQSTYVNVNIDVRVQGAYTGCGELRLRLAAVGEGVPGLSMQVRGFEMISINERETTDPRAGKILQYRDAETSGTDDGDTRGAKPGLTRSPDLAEIHLPRVIGYPRCGGMIMMRVVVVRMIVVRMIVMRMIGRCGAAFAVDPARITVDVVFLFPNGDAVLHFVDDVPTRSEGLVTMARTYADPHCELAEGKIPDAMHAPRVLDTEARTGLRDDSLALSNGELRKRLVLEASNFPAFIVITHPTLECGIPAARGIDELCAERLGVQPG
jgi:hypothetical protein